MGCSAFAVSETTWSGQKALGQHEHACMGFLLHMQQTPQTNSNLQQHVVAVKQAASGMSQSCMTDHHVGEGSQGWVVFGPEAECTGDNRL